MTDAVPLTARSRLVLAFLALASLLAFCWPLFLPPDASMTMASQGPLLFAVVLPVLVVVTISELTSQEMDVKALAMLGVLTAVGTILRPLGAGTAGIEAVYLPIVLAGRVFGPGFGFLLGNTTLFCSALLTGGVGPWLPYQMVAAGLVGMGAGLLPRRATGRAEVTMLAGYAFVAAFAYGWLLDFAFWPFSVALGNQLGYQASAPIGQNLYHFALYKLATAMAWDAGRAISNLLLVGLLGGPLLAVLRRSSRRPVFA